MSLELNSANLLSLCKTTESTDFIRLSFNERFVAQKVFDTLIIVHASALRCSRICSHDLLSRARSIQCSISEDTVHAGQGMGLKYVDGTINVQSVPSSTEHVASIWSSDDSLVST